MPYGKWNTIKALARNTPIPVQVFNPIFIASFHKLWLPGYLVSKVNEGIFMFKNFYKPLLKNQILNLLFTAFMSTDAMGNGFLINKGLRLSQKLKNFFTSVVHIQSCKRSG